MDRPTTTPSPRTHRHSTSSSGGTVDRAVSKQSGRGRAGERRKTLMRKRITLLIAALAMALTMSLGGVSFAKITAVDTACTNNGGPQAGGQQPPRKKKGEKPET